MRYAGRTTELQQRGVVKVVADAEYGKIHPALLRSSSKYEEHGGGVLVLFAGARCVVE